MNSPCPPPLRASLACSTLPPLAESANEVLAKAAQAGVQSRTLAAPEATECAYAKPAVWEIILVGLSLLLVALAG